MSFPGPVVPIASGVAAGAQSTMDVIIGTINTNPYFIGLMMIMLNLGGRFLGLEITPQQERFFQHPYVRRFLIFVVLFVATRNIWIAFWMTIVIVLCIGYLLNERSALCIFNFKGVRGATCTKEGFTATAVASTLTPLEEEIYQKLAAKRGAAGAAIKETDAKKEEFAVGDVQDILKLYSENIQKLHKMQ